MRKILQSPEKFTLKSPWMLHKNLTEKPCACNFGAKNLSAWTNFKEGLLPLIW